MLVCIVYKQTKNGNGRIVLGVTSNSHVVIGVVEALKHQLILLADGRTAGA